MICGLVSGDAAIFRETEDFQQRVVDGFDLRARLGLRPAEQFDTAVDDSSGVGRVVGRVENVACGERLAVPRVEQLIIRRAADDLDFELRDGLVVQYAAERAGRKDVGLDRINFLRPDALRTALIQHALDALAVNVRHDQLRPGLS